MIESAQTDQSGPPIIDSGLSMSLASQTPEVPATPPVATPEVPMPVETSHDSKDDGHQAYGGENSPENPWQAKPLEGMTATPNTESTPPLTVPTVETPPQTAEPVAVVENPFAPITQQAPEAPTPTIESVNPMTEQKPTEELIAPSPVEVVSPFTPVTETPAEVPAAPEPLPAVGEQESQTEPAKGPDNGITFLMGEQEKVQAEIARVNKEADEKIAQIESDRKAALASQEDKATKIKTAVDAIHSLTTT